MAAEADSDFEAYFSPSVEECFPSVPKGAPRLLNLRFKSKYNRIMREYTISIADMNDTGLAK